MFPDKYESNIYFDKIIYRRDFEILSPEWHSMNFDEINNNIANFIVLDVPKRSLAFKAKKTYYSNIKFVETIACVFMCIFNSCCGEGDYSGRYLALGKVCKASRKKAI